MQLQLRHRQNEGIRILDLEGHVVEGASEGALRDAIFALADANDVKIILNFAGVRKIDVDGVSALSFCHARIVKSGGALKLLNLARHHLSPMVLAELGVKFEVFTDEQDAVNSFFPDRAVRHYDILEFVEESERGPAPDGSK